MDREDSLQRLAKLSERQRAILQSVCDGLAYKAIGDRLSIAEGTVKTHMGNIYIKLGLAYLSRTERVRALREVYCPALRTAKLLPGPTDEEPEPVPGSIQDMVDDDEHAIVIWQKPEPPAVIEVRPTDARRPQPPDHGGGLGRLILGILLGGLVVGGGFLLLRGTGGNGVPTPAGATQATATARIAEVTVVVTPTPAPAQPTAAPTVIVVTATPPPVPTEPPASPTPTEPPNTPEDAVLEVTEWWQTNGVWLRISKADFTADGNIYITLEMWNKTASQLIFEWTMAGNFTLTDNTGHVYEINYGGGRDGDRESYEAGEFKPVNLGPYASTVSYYDSYLFNAAVTDLYLTVTDLSRISHAQFHFKAPK